MLHGCTYHGWFRDGPEITIVALFFRAHSEGWTARGWFLESSWAGPKGLALLLLNKFGSLELITYLYTMKIFKIKEYGKHEFHSIADQRRAEKKAFDKARNKRKRK